MRLTNNMKLVRFSYHLKKWNFVDTRQEIIQKLLLEALREVSFDDIGDDLDKNVIPISDLNLNSVDGISCTISMSEKLGFRIPNNVNLFYDKKNGPRNIEEIVACIKKLI